MLPAIKTLAATAAFGAVLLTASASAQAAAVTLTGWTYGAGHAVRTSGPVYTGRAGGFTGRLEGAGAGFDTPSFQTYCVELTERFSFSRSPMQGYEVVDGLSYFGAATAERIGKLVTWVHDNTWAVDSSRESASMQLALWNLIYDGDNSLTQGLFRDARPRAGYATQLLGWSQGLEASRFDVFVLRKAGSQDFLLTRLRVPEPGSVALVALALAGLAAARRTARQR